MSRIRAAFLDCDGVIADTEVSLGVGCARETCEEFGIPITEQELSKKPGNPDGEWWTKILATRQVDVDLETVLVAQFQRYRRLLPTVALFKGSRELVEEIQEESIPTALVSGSQRFQIELILSRLALTRGFNAVVTHQEMEGKTKPDPFGYELALRMVNASLAAQRTQEPPIQPDEVVVLEDTLRGIMSARRARMHVIGVVNNGLEDLSGEPNVIQTLEDLRRRRLDEWLAVSQRI